jgi:predicted lipoprotein with Yx(FWY)xxD motif
MKRLIPLLAVAAAAAASVVIATSGGGSAGAGTAAARSAQRGTTVAVRVTKLGRTLVDGRGRTLYLFERDRSTTSACVGACASLWPLLTTAGRPHAGAGAQAGKLGVNRAGQVIYAGHPLYLYAGDRRPGDLNGQGLDQFGAKWYVLAPSGAKIDDDDS